MEQLQSYRGLTREVIEAEQVYVEARTEAVRYGIVGQYMDEEAMDADEPYGGSDGSGQTGVEASDDPAAICRWYNTVLAATSPYDLPYAEEESGEISGPECLRIDADVNDWDATSIQLWESGSMVAQGFDRWRIDTWLSEIAARTVHPSVDHEVASDVCE